MIMHRTLNEIENTKKVIVEGILECERRIIKLEEVIGWRTGDG